MRDRPLSTSRRHATTVYDGRGRYLGVLELVNSRHGRTSKIAVRSSSGRRLWLVPVHCTRMDDGILIVRPVASHQASH